MFNHSVKTPEQALAYITDCTLATVSAMAMKKNRPKGEFERQISISQTAIDWMVAMDVDMSSTRAVEVLECGSVLDWARTFIEQP